MPGRGYKPASPELKEQARAMRKEGQTIEKIAADLGVSTGSVSGWCRDIPAKGTQVKKEAPSGRRESKDIMDLTASAKLDSETADLANRVRKARLQGELDDIEDRKRQRQEIEDLRIRERKILLELDTARQGATKGESAVVGELTELRRELAELREARHQAEIRQIEDRHAAEMTQLRGAVASMRQTGLGAFDIMAKSLDKAENLAIIVSEKVDGLVKGSQGDKQLMTALSLGLTPSEYTLLLQGEDLFPTREEWELGRKLRAKRDRVPLEEPEPGEYEDLMSHIQKRNECVQAVMAKVAQKLGQGSTSVVKTSKPRKEPASGKEPAPGQAEPAVLKAESKLVTCSRCSSTFDIDLVEAKNQAATGKKLFVNCANPKCNFLLDITELLPELAKSRDKSTTPECYVAGQDGRCNSELRGPEQCIDCQWFAISIKNFVYE